MSPDRQRRASSGRGAGRVFALVGGVLFAVSLVIALLQYAGPWGRTTLSGGVAAATWNTVLFTVFALHHSLFARAAIKQWIASAIPPWLERSAYVWISSGLFLLVCLTWQPVAGEAWRVDGSLATLLTGIQMVGIALTLAASRRLDILSLAGVRQAWASSPRTSAPESLVETGLYRLVRHPIYFAWVLMVWPTPAMTGTRLCFAILSTLYLAVAIPFEERTLRPDVRAGLRTLCDAGEVENDSVRILKRFRVPEP